MLALSASATLSGEPACVELAMFPDKWGVARHRVSIMCAAKTFAPGNLRATADNPHYK
jgi:hypothetical protein